ncbi:MAG: hypothetical protein H0S79_07375 [Anaerolineaceae bacterium]|nr:hypothetical protein [Anaerolineaceae bacterium]
MQDKTVLGFLSARRYEVQALILVHSLRHFGGELADIPVWIYVPAGQEMRGPALDALKALKVEIIPFALDETLWKFPFAAKAVASALAEVRAEAEGVQLAWHDRTGMVANEPKGFILPPGKSIGFRPTDIANIGAPYGEPLPPFWQKIAAHFDLSADQLPPITTAIDQKTLHLYVNAGLLVVRPEKKTLRTWAANLEATYLLPGFKPFYQENQAYAIFMHQAALTAAVVQTTQPEERLILPDSYLFSVDNFFDYPEEMQPALLDDITTGRFHEFFALENWRDLVIASEDLLQWFETQLSYGPYWPEA